MKNKKTASDFFIEHGLAPPSPISGDDESFSNSVSRPEVSIVSGTSAYQSKRRRRSNQIPSQVTAIAQEAMKSAAQNAPRMAMREVYFHLVCK